MVRVAAAVLLIAFCPSAASADDQPAIKTIQQVFGQKIIFEMNAALACQMSLENDLQKIAELEGRIKELEARSKEPEAKQGSN
jgi:predicted outer membrane protein